MAFIEMSDILVRGELRGAIGKAKFKMTSKAINAVDTLHIAGNQVTYTFYFTYPSKSVTSGGVSLTGTFNVPDQNAWVEIIAYGHGAASIKIDGTTQPNRNKREPSSKIMPFITVVPLAKGNHSIQIVSGITGTSSGGWIFCRYIRRTGSDNL